MKTKVLIISFLIVSLCLAFSHISYSQDRTDSSKVLIADESWLTYTKTGAKIITYSESAFQAISLKWGLEFKAIHIYYKKDRNGPYKEYQILISQETGNNIKLWAVKNL